MNLGGSVAVNLSFSENHVVELEISHVVTFSTFAEIRDANGWSRCEKRRRLRWISHP